MELLTNNIQTRDTLFQSDLQITLEDDFNVADTKPDMEQLIKTKGNIEPDKTKKTDGIRNREKPKKLAEYRNQLNREN